MGSIPEDKDYREYLNPESLKIIRAFIDSQAVAMANQAVSGQDGSRIRFQFERLGYFVADYDTTKEKPVFNRICTLKDTFSKTLNQL
jgi:glutaminyl-tRNA synthetase